MGLSPQNTFVVCIVVRLFHICMIYRLNAIKEEAGRNKWASDIDSNTVNPL